MINLNEFLLKQNLDLGTYALVTHNGITEPTWFTRYTYREDGDWFLESPCTLYEITNVNESIDEFCKRYMEEMIELEDGESINDYIEKFVKPMIVDNVFYEIENFQVSPCLPKEVDDIKLITERECLEYMLNHKKS